MGTWSFSPALSSVGLTSTTSNNNVTIKISNKATALDNAGKTIVATFKDDDGCTKSTKFTLKKCSIIPTDPCEIKPLDSAIPWNASNAVVVAHTNSEANWTRFDYVSGDSDFAHPSYAPGGTEITATITQNEDSRQRTATYNAINEEDGCTKQFDVKQAGKSSPSTSCEITGLTIPANSSGTVMIGKLPLSYYNKTTHAGGVVWHPYYYDWLGGITFTSETTETDFFPIEGLNVQPNTNTEPRSVTLSASCANGGCEGCEGGTFTVTQLGTGGGCTELTTQCDTYINFTFQDKETTSSRYGINSLCTFYLKKNGQDIPVTFFKYNALDSGTCNKFRFEPTGSPDNVELKNLQFFYNKTVQDLINYQSNELDGEELFFLKGSTTNQTHNDNTNVSNKLHSFLTSNTLDIVNNCVGLEFSTTTPPVFYAFYGDYRSGVGTHDIFTADNFGSGVIFENGQSGNAKMFYINFKRNNADLTKFYNCN